MESLAVFGIFSGNVRTLSQLTLLGLLMQRLHSTLNSRDSPVFFPVEPFQLFVDLLKVNNAQKCHWLRFLFLLRPQIPRCLGGANSFGTTNLCTKVCQNFLPKWSNSIRFAVPPFNLSALPRTFPSTLSCKFHILETHHKATVHWRICPTHLLDRTSLVLTSCWNGN
jgi:hypothetical protein